MTRLACLCVVVGLVAGCAPTISPRYYPSAKNAIALREIAALRPAPALTVGPFEGGPDSVSCRLAPIGPPDRQSFAQFIRGAFLDEMSLSGLATEQAGLELRGRLQTIDVECNFGTGRWTVAFEYSVGSQPPFLVKIDYPFEGASSGMVVFLNAQQALVPAVQDLIHAVITSPEFRAAVK